MKTRSVKKSKLYFGFFNKTKTALIKGLNTPASWLALAFGVVAMACFPSTKSFALVLFPTVSLLAYQAFRVFFKGKEDERNERSFSRFLSYLATAVSSGRNLELSLIQADHKLKKELGEGSPMQQEVKQLSLSLYAGLGLRFCLERIAKTFSQHSIFIFSRILPSSLELGGNYALYLQLHRDALQKDLELASEIKAEQSASVAEAFIMSLMPFALSFIMSRTSYRQEFNDFAYISIIEAALLVFSVIGFAISLTLMITKPKSPTLAIPRLPAINLSNHIIKSGANKLAHLIEKLYGTARCSQIKDHLRYLLPQEKFLFPRYCLSKMLFVILAFPFLLILEAKPPFFLVLVLLFFLPDARLYDGVKKMREAEIMEYPPFLTLLSILLESGLSLERSLQLCLTCFIRPNEKTKLNLWQRIFRKHHLTLLEFDLSGLQHSLESGLAADDALEKLANSRFQADIAQCLHLIVRYAREGSDEQIQMIRMQALRSTDNYRNAMREKLGKKSLKLLLPMTYELILIILIAALPAILQIRA